MCTAVESRAVATIPWVAVASTATGRTIVAMEPLTVVRTAEFRIAVVHIVAARIVVVARTAVARTAVARIVVESIVVESIVVAAESSVVAAANNSGYSFGAGMLLKHMKVDSWKGTGLAYCALPSCSLWAVEQPFVEGLESVAETQIVVAVIADKRLVVASSMFGQWLVATDE